MKGCASCKSAVAFGGVAGLGVGVLNLAAIAHGWTLTDYFDVLDFPVISLTVPNYQFLGLLVPRGYAPETLRAILLYWILIGMFLGWIFCLARKGVIRDIAGDKGCRYALFAGACGGMLIGSLSFLAASNGWEELGILFESFNRPVHTLMDILEDQFPVVRSLMADLSTEFVCLHVAGIVYWMMMGLFLASLFCVTRILVKRKGATGIQVAKE